MTKTTRAPRDMGCGIYIHSQPFLTPEKLVKGDSFFDADYGPMVWTGTKWISEEDWDDIKWDGIQRSWSRYAKKHGRASFLEFLKLYYHHPKKK